MTIYDTCLDIILFVCEDSFCVHFSSRSQTLDQCKNYDAINRFSCAIFFSSQNTFLSMGNSAKTLRCYLCVIIALLRHNRIHISYVPRITINFNGKIYCQIIRFSDMQTKEVGVNKINLIKCISCSIELYASAICKMW